MGGVENINTRRRFVLDVPIFLFYIFLLDRFVHELMLAVLALTSVMYWLYDLIDLIVSRNPVTVIDCLSCLVRLPVNAFLASLSV